jgi:hypothetical protein
MTAVVSSLQDAPLFVLCVVCVLVLIAGSGVFHRLATAADVPGQTPNMGECWGALSLRGVFYAVACDFRKCQDIMAYISIASYLWVVVLHIGTLGSLP